MLRSSLAFSVACTSISVRTPKPCCASASRVLATASPNPSAVVTVVPYCMAVPPVSRSGWSRQHRRQLVGVVLAPTGEPDGTSSHRDVVRQAAAVLEPGGSPQPWVRPIPCRGQSSGVTSRRADECGCAAWRADGGAPRRRSRHRRTGLPAPARDRPGSRPARPCPAGAGRASGPRARAPPTAARFPLPGTQAQPLRWSPYPQYNIVPLLQSRPWGRAGPAATRVNGQLAVPAGGQRKSPPRVSGLAARGAAS